MDPSSKPENVNIQFSAPTPDSELDDHRNQPQNLPRADSTNQGHGRRSFRRNNAGEQVGLLGVEDALRGLNARDFENAIEDGSSGRPSFDRARRGSVSPLADNRRTHFRRGRRNRDETQDRSRDSSSSSRSSSQANSVEAFAEPHKRGRAGTFTSIAPSYQSGLAAAAAAERAGSISTFNRGRTLSEDQVRDHLDADNISKQPTVEDDVCYPAEENARAHRIDFDDLQEFVDRFQPAPLDTEVPHPFGAKQDMKPYASRAQILNELRAKDLPVDAVPAAMVENEMARKSNNSLQLSIGDKALQGVLGDKRLSLAVEQQINRWSFFSSELEDTIHAPELGDLLMPGETFESLFELGPSGGVWWLDMLMPSEEEVEVVCKAFGVHGLTREDIIQQETREKVELFKSYYFVCFRSFYQMDKQSQRFLEPVNVYAVVFREGILTFTFCPSPHAGNVRQRMSKLRDFVALGADWICYALIDDIVDSFQPVIRKVEHLADAIEDEVFTVRPEDSRALLRRVGECRKMVMSLIRLLSGKADVIKGFAKRCNEQYEIAPRQDVGLYLSDIQDHIITMMSNLGHFDTMMTRSHTNYLAQISVDNAIQSFKANTVLNKVTFVASVFVPMNLVCGMFGMNVDVPGRSSLGLAWFFGIVGCLALFVLVATVVARRMRLI